ncbi:mRNA turnover protein 4 homolog [Anneissia japonica]|uniref:mRNA turnover protein 4 homolog n=1 Tax=Anneissia japonica TaxID=1529436 RepID=UPI0014254CAE|nr:mRNA turnover protein 4 homolog [Anneissia japonica]
MPKSKRDKRISLTNTKKKGLELKQKLIQEVQDSVDKFSRIFLFSVDNMRNVKLKEVRNRWRHSRFFFGKNKVMSVALGRTREDEYRENLHQLSKKLTGNVGLLFTNEKKDDVMRWFDDFQDPDYARTGNKALFNYELDQGPLDQFPHSLEPQLRQLGLPTTLKKGVIHMIDDYTVCKEGQTLTPEQARILVSYYLEFLNLV